MVAFSVDTKESEILSASSLVGRQKLVLGWLEIL
jgi:hypothetical protein